MSDAIQRKIKKEEKERGDVVMIGSDGQSTALWLSLSVLVRFASSNYEYAEQTHEHCRIYIPRRETKRNEENTGSESESEIF